MRDDQIQQIVDSTILSADTDADGKLSEKEFAAAVDLTDVVSKMTIRF